MNAAWAWGALGISLMLGCGGSGTSADPDGATGTPMSCGAVASMEVGRCVVDSGGDCQGALGEVYSLTSLSDGDAMRMVVGPQGSTMLVFLVRTDGIDPGDSASTYPLVQVSLFDTAARRQLTEYRQRVSFVADGAGFRSEQLWVVVDALASDLSGRNVTATARLTDRNGVARCAIVDVSPQR